MQYQIDGILWRIITGILPALFAGAVLTFKASACVDNNQVVYPACECVLNDWL